MTKEEDIKEKIMHKYLENPNTSYNSIEKELQMHPYIISCKYIPTPLVVLFNVSLKKKIDQTKIWWWENC